MLASYPEFAGCSITVPAGALFADDGSPGVAAGIAPVPSDRLPGPLPEQFDMGIVITVVSIIVQLSADRYTGVARMFLRDRVNMSVFGFYLVVCVIGVWTSFALQSHFVPRAAVIGVLIATAGQDNAKC